MRRRDATGHDGAQRRGARGKAHPVPHRHQPRRRHHRRRRHLRRRRQRSVAPGRARRGGGHLHLAGRPRPGPGQAAARLHGHGRAKGQEHRPAGPGVSDRSGGGRAVAGRRTGCAPVARRRCRPGGPVGARRGGGLDALSAPAGARAGAGVDGAHGLSAPRQAVDRGAGVRQPEPGPRPGLLQRRHHRGHHFRALQVPGDVRHRPQLELHLQGKAGEGAAGGRGAGGALRAGGPSATTPTRK